MYQNRIENDGKVVGKTGEPLNRGIWYYVRKDAKPQIEKIHEDRDPDKIEKKV